jgi:TRAP-type mannitol/chloroaromatic compound transport system substrate-binding protein
MRISIELPDDIAILWDEANKLAKENGVHIEGDMTNGSFSIKGFRATYTVSGRTLTALAGNVPSFLTEKKVKEEIQKWFNARK